MTYTQDTLVNYLNVQIVINNLNDKYYFPDLPQLRTSKITGISFYPSMIGNTADPNGVPLISLSNAQKCFLTLYSGDIQKVQNLPLLKMKNLYFYDPGSSDIIGNQEGIFALNDLVIDFSKSYVSLASNTTIVGTLPLSINFGIYYK